MTRRPTMSETKIEGGAKTLLADLRIPLAEMRTWSAVRIERFFAGIAEAVNAAYGHSVWPGLIPPDRKAGLECAQKAVSDWHWIVGECIYRYLQLPPEERLIGRGAAAQLPEVASIVGVTLDQANQCVDVFTRFAESRSKYPALRWSHFYAALQWDDAESMLAWANEVQSTVAEMRAYRRAQRGEDLSVEESDAETAFTVMARRIGTA